MNLTVQKYFKYFYSNRLLSVISEPCKITLSGMPIIDNIEEVFVRRANKVDLLLNHPQNSNIYGQYVKIV